MFEFLKNYKQKTETDPAPQVGCFGKLPIYDEFIRYNVNGRAALELDEWIQQGYYHHSRDVQMRHEKIELNEYIYSFVFTGQRENSSLLMGTIMGSHDKCGRQFPFVVFKQLPKQATEALTSTLPCAYRTFFENSLEFCLTDWDMQPITVVRGWVESLDAGSEVIPRKILLESEVNALQEISKKKFWCDMLQDSAQVNAPLVVEAMKDLLDTVVRKSPLRTSWGIEVPLPGNGRSYQHVSFWVHAAECLLGDRGWRPHYIWGNMTNCYRQTLYLFFRPVSPIFFSHLLGHRVDNGILINLEQECKEQGYVSSAAEQIGGLDTDDHMVNAFKEWLNWSRS
jgi:type VI secretion system protein ImpM